MKPLPHKRMLRARRRRLLHDAEQEVIDQVQQPDYAYEERWQREHVDPRTTHDVSVDIREDWPNGRTRCSCGFDTDWIPLWDAEQRARHHHSLADKLRVPVSGRMEGGPVMLNRSLFTHLARIELEPARTPPVLPLPILDEQQPIFLVFDQRDLGIEMAYERQEEIDGTRVRAATRDTMAYWIPQLTPVFAVTDGVIVYARKHGEGHTIVIDHCNGWLSVYHRLEHMFVSPSERDLRRETKVAGGDVLGYLAPTTTGALKPLRFELWKQARDKSFDPVDPLRYVRRWRHITWDEPANDAA